MVKLRQRRAHASEWRKVAWSPEAGAARRSAASASYDETKDEASSIRIVQLAGVAWSAAAAAAIKSSKAEAVNILVVSL